MSRTVNVVRMQLVNRMTYVWVPLIVLVGSFLVTLAIYGILANAGVSGPKYGGGAQAPLWVFLSVGIYALTLTFPFSQAMSVTRREFFGGTMLSAMLTSALLAAVFLVGGLLESITGGWGMEGYFFYLPWIWAAGPAIATVFYFTIALLFFIVGFWSATIYKRFGPIGLTIVLVGLGVLLVAGLFFIGRANAWAQVFTWFAKLGVSGLTLGGLLVSALLAAIAYVTLRRTIP